MAYK
ncbi:uncharacterized protein FFM5_01577 [Fusarium fujikuroi]|jgi:hypothetical protein